MSEYNYVNNNIGGNVGGKRNVVFNKQDFDNLMNKLISDAELLNDSEKTDALKCVYELKEAEKNGFSNRSLLKKVLERLKSVGGNKIFQETVGKISLLIAEYILMQ